MFNATIIPRIMCQELDNIWTYSRMRRCKKCHFVDVRKTKKSTRLPPADQQYVQMIIKMQPCSMVTVNQPPQILSQVIIQGVESNRIETGIQTSLKNHVQKKIIENSSTSKCVEDKFNMTDVSVHDTGTQPSAVILKTNDEVVEPKGSEKSQEVENAVYMTDNSNFKTTQTIRSYIKANKLQKILKIRLECEPAAMKENGNISSHVKIKRGEHKSNEFLMKCAGIRHLKGTMSLLGVPVLNFPRRVNSCYELTLYGRSIEMKEKKPSSFPPLAPHLYPPRKPIPPPQFPTCRTGKGKKDSKK